MSEFEPKKGQLSHEFKFFGIDSRKLDDKGRVSLPPAIKQASRTLLIMPHPEMPCILGWKPEQWDAGASSADPRLIRAVHALSRRMNVDDDGRVLLKVEERKHLEAASFPVNVCVVGQQTHFEIWTEKNWQQEKKKLVADFLTFHPLT